MSEKDKFYDKDALLRGELGYLSNETSYHREELQDSVENGNRRVSLHSPRSETSPKDEDPSTVGHPQTESVTQEADKEEPSPKDRLAAEDEKDNLEESIYPKDSSYPNTLRSETVLLLQQLAVPTEVHPMPLGRPISLQVGSFENILKDLKTSSDPSLETSKTISIRLYDMMRTLERASNESETLDKLWEESRGPERTNLAENMLRMFKQNIKPTLVVVVENKQFRCHAIVLQLVSQFFRHATLGKTHIYHLPGSMVNACAFVTMYRWALEPIHQTSTNYLLHVLRAAQFFDCPELVADIWNAMGLLTRDPVMAVALYQRSLTLGIYLDDNLLGPLSTIFLQFAASLEFKQMEAATVKRLLAMDSLAVNSEMEVYMAAVLWLDYKWPERQCHAAEIMKGVRFEHMPFLFLFSLVRRTDGPPVLRFLAGLPEIRKRALLTLDEIDVAASKYQGRCGNTSRNWIFDPRSHYHHGKACRRIQFLSYDSFVKYLAWLQTTGPKHCLTVRSIHHPDNRCCPARRAIF
ncbi:uncharacterized protein [Drosophila bipectinata]|uniref:uncharacterized protein n=1 Tax=Drosophila bipectinata TaxID=42026 RepID=UPI0038B280DA